MTNTRNLTNAMGKFGSVKLNTRNLTDAMEQFSTAELELFLKGRPMWFLDGQLARYAYALALRKTKNKRAKKENKLWR